MSTELIPCLRCGEIPKLVDMATCTTDMVAGVEWDWRCACSVSQRSFTTKAAAIKSANRRVPCTCEHTWGQIRDHMKKPSKTEAEAVGLVMEQWWHDYQKGLPQSLTAIVFLTSIGMIKDVQLGDGVTERQPDWDAYGVRYGEEVGK